MTVHEIRPLHLGKFVPPPFAGVEAHIDTLLTTLLPEARATLVAGESPARVSSPPALLPYRTITTKSFGKFASATLSPGVVTRSLDELKSGRCNLLHLHAPNPWADFVSILAPRGVPRVISWHSDIVRQKRLLKVYGPIQQKSIRLADRIISPTPKHYESSRQLKITDCSKKIVFIPYGIDFDTLHATTEADEFLHHLRKFAAGRRIVLTVGRHVYYKGYEDLLLAFSKTRSQAVLVMIGSGVLSGRLAALAGELGIADRVLLTGEVNNSSMVTAMRHCDVFTLPSIAPAEGFGIASAEAMSFGKPTVVCELNNGVTYLNREGVTSLVVPPTDVNALAHALDTLVRDDGLRSRMGSAASEWVRSEFSIQKMKTDMLSLYRSLL
jgi:rhamnosyl/mannosyltransferase